MIIFKDQETGDELFTDAYKIVEEKTCFKLTGKLTSRKEGQIDDSLIGANASAEEQTEQTEEQAQSGLDFVMDARLHEVKFDKKTCRAYMKDYFKKLKSKCDAEKMEDFECRAKEFCVFIMENFKEVDFYFGETDHAGEHGCLFVIWKDNGIEADAYIFKEAVYREKC